MPQICSSGAPAPERRMERRTPPCGPLTQSQMSESGFTRLEDLQDYSVWGDCNVLSAAGSWGIGEKKHLFRSVGPIGKPFRARSAGACPPRSLACPSDCSSGAPAPERRMERRTPPWPVARGPVPRERSTYAENARRPKPFPRPRHGEGQALALR